MAYYAESEVWALVCNTSFVEKYSRFNLISVVVAGLRYTCAILEQTNVEIDVIVLRDDFRHGFEIYSLIDLDRKFRPAVFNLFCGQVDRIRVCIEVLLYYFKSIEVSLLQCRNFCLKGTNFTWLSSDITVYLSDLLCVLGNDIEVCSDVLGIYLDVIAVNLDTIIISCDVIPNGTDISF